MLVDGLGGFVFGAQILQLGLQTVDVRDAAAPKPELRMQGNEEGDQQGGDDALRNHDRIVPVFLLYLQAFSASSRRRYCAGRYWNRSGWVHGCLRSKDRRLDGCSSLRAVFPAGGAEQLGGATHDIQRIGLSQMRQTFDAHLLQAKNNGRPDAFDGEEGLAFADGEGHG